MTEGTWILYNFVLIVTFISKQIILFMYIYIYIYIYIFFKKDQNKADLEKED
jgi:hypothetical protein